MPLSAFPKTVGLTELKKGYFPHLFNTREHDQYMGPQLALDYYMPKGTSIQQRAEFEQWHAQRVAEGTVFDVA